MTLFWHSAPSHSPLLALLPASVTHSPLAIIYHRRYMGELRGLGKEDIKGGEEVGDTLFIYMNDASLLIPGVIYGRLLALVALFWHSQAGSRFPPWHPWHLWEGVLNGTFGLT